MDARAAGSIFVEPFYWDPSTSALRAYAQGERCSLNGRCCAIEVIDTIPTQPSL